MQTVLHCKNSNKEGHIHHLLPERESQGDGWMMTQDLAEFKSPPHRRFWRCCQGGHTFFAGCSPLLPHLTRSRNWCSPSELWCGCWSLTCKATPGAEFLSSAVCWARGSIKPSGGNFYCWSLTMKWREGDQHGGIEGKSGAQMWFQCDLKEHSCWIRISC